MLIVPMSGAHIDAVAQLRVETFFVGSSRTQEIDAEGLSHLIAGDGFEAAFVCEVDGHAVGSCLFVRHELDPVHELTPWLAGLVVAPAFRRRGIGAQLVEAVEKHARRVGCSELYLYTDEVEPFYAKLGWETADRFTTNGEPSVLMTRTL
ncbi:MAG TPA: GNAT family N-acetyltransferase [Rhizobiaceae bacterium]|nr:GNAT family N-acetyltransferase [Rhizobiaceae bacterium]